MPGQQSMPRQMAPEPSHRLLRGSFPGQKNASTKQEKVNSMSRGLGYSQPSTSITNKAMQGLHLYKFQT